MDLKEIVSSTIIEKRPAGAVVNADANGFSIIGGNGKRKVSFKIKVSKLDDKRAKKLADVISQFTNVFLDKRFLIRKHRLHSDVIVKDNGVSIKIYKQSGQRKKVVVDFVYEITKGGKEVSKIEVVNEFAEAPFLEFLTGFIDDFKKVYL